MCVAEESALPLIAKRINGNRIGKTSSARWRSVRRTDRRATAQNCSRRPGAVARSAATSAPGAVARHVLLVRACGGALELAAGLGEEDIVERRLVQVQRGDMHAGLVEHAHELGELRLALGQPDADALAAVARGLDEPRQDLCEALPLAGLGGDELDGRAADVCLQSRGSVLRDDATVVDDPDAIGE